MDKVSKDGTDMTIGVDLGDKWSRLCVLDEHGEVCEEGRIATTADAMRKHFSTEAPCRIVIEVGTHSPWVQRLLQELGHEVITAHTQSVRLIYGGTNKDDRLDAERLARLGRLDPKLLHPIRRSRALGAYLGLSPRRSQSGDDDPELRITKAGGNDLRRLLVGSAQYILGPFGPDTDLRRWGLALAARGRKNAKKRAVVAVARKLAVLLHRLWVSAEVYEPLRNPANKPDSIAQAVPA